MTSSLRKVRRGKDLSLLTRYTHAFWKATSAIQADGCHYHFLIWILRSDPFCRQNPCSFCNILPFNFVPTPNKSLRFRGFRRSSGNHPVFVVANLSKLHCIFLLDVRRSKCDHVPFFVAVCSQWECICVIYFCWQHPLLKCC